MAGVRVVRPEERVVGPSTPGMAREQAIVTEDLWSGFVTTEPAMVSAWHHHGGHRTVFYGAGHRDRVPDGDGRVGGEPRGPRGLS